MTLPSSPRPSDLEIQDVLRRRAAEMHQQVDTWLELTLRELGVEMTEEDVAHTLGVSFEPSVQLTRLPGELDHERVSTGFFTLKADVNVEVVPGDEPGMVYFHIPTADADVQLCALDEAVFEYLFQPVRLPSKAVLTQQLRPESRVKYGLHPIYKSVALRYNVDGSITRGQFGDNGEFLAED